MAKVPMLAELERKYEKNKKGRSFAPLAEAYRKKGELKKALRLLNEHMPFNSGFLLGHITLAKCFFETGLFQKAHDEVVPFIASNKENLHLQELYGDICVKLKLNELAVESYKHVLFYRPKNELVFQKLRDIEEEVSPIRDPGIPASDIDSWEEVSTSCSSLKQSAKDDERDSNFMDYFDQKMKNFDLDLLDTKINENILENHGSAEAKLTDLTLLKSDKETEENSEEKNYVISRMTDRVNLFLTLLRTKGDILQKAS